MERRVTARIERLRITPFGAVEVVEKEVAALVPQHLALCSGWGVEIGLPEDQ